MKQALLIIDVQEGFFFDKNCPIYKEDFLTDNINKLIEKFRKTREPIVFILHTDKEELIKGNREWQVYAKINSEQSDYFVDKTTPDSFLNTDLMAVLEKNKIDRIIVAGLQTDYCIDTTCRSAYGKNIKTILVSDAHSTYDNSFMDAPEIIAYHNKLIGSWFAILKQTNEIIND